MSPKEISYRKYTRWNLVSVSCILSFIKFEGQLDL